MANTNSKSAVSLEERKRTLLAEGALFRARIIQARGTVSAGLSAESLAKGMLSRVVGTFSSLLSGAFAGKISNLQTLSPLLFGGISLLSRRSLRKPLLYGLVISASAACAYYLARGRRSGRHSSKTGDTPASGDI